SPRIASPPAYTIRSSRLGSKRWRRALPCPMRPAYCTSRPCWPRTSCPGPARTDAGARRAEVWARRLALPGSARVADVQLLPDAFFYARRADAAARVLYALERARPRGVPCSVVVACEEESAFTFARTRTANSG